MALELETKFIEGTNNKYSIRSDGVITQHYRLFKGKIIETNITSFKEVTNVLNKTCLMINGKQTTITIRCLLKRTFGYTHCLLCNEKMSNINQQHCDKCKTETRDRIRKQWVIDNPKRCKELNDINHLFNKEIVSKSYMASNLKVSVDSISEEELVYYRILLKTKRLLAQKLNCSIETFNK